jgi:hypothetical protein
MKRLFSCALPLLMLALALPALGQPAAAKKVTLDLNGVAPDAAFKAVADAIGVTVTVDAAVTAPVDITVRNVSAKTALTAMCESIGCQWSLTGANLVVRPLASSTFAAKTGTPKDDAARARQERTQSIMKALDQPLPADMRFENAPLEIVSKRLTEALGIPLRLSCKDPAVKTLTVDLGRLTLRSAMQAIASQEPRPKAAWQIMIGPMPGDPQTTFGIMVGPKAVQKTVTKRQ